jgi:hypothetical protein
MGTWELYSTYCTLAKKCPLKISFKNERKEERRERKGNGDTITHSHLTNSLTSDQI